MTPARKQEQIFTRWFMGVSAAVVTLAIGGSITWAFRAEASISRGCAERKSLKQSIESIDKKLDIVIQRLPAK